MINETNHRIDALMLLENALDGDGDCLNATGLMPMAAVYYAYSLLQGPVCKEAYEAALFALSQLRARNAIDESKR